MLFHIRFHIILDPLEIRIIGNVLFGLLPILVTNAEIIQIKGFLMAILYAFLSPGRLRGV